MDCLFCKIVSGEVPSTKVYENDKVLAFNDINPLAPVHILVIPKKHYTSIKDVPDSEMEIIAEIHKVINYIAKEKGIDKTGFRIINNCGEDANQVVKHIHYHVLGGKKLNP